ncbi:MAG: peroxiredoxin family protein [Thiohalospira sp.]
MGKRKGLAGGVLAAVVFAAGLWLWTGSGVDRAPDVTVETLEGKQLELADLRGQPVLVNFWATDCPGCIEEMPHLKELYTDLSDDGLQMVAIAMSYDDPEADRQLAERRDLPWRITHDADGSLAKAFGDVNLTPTTFLIDPEGRIVQETIGVLDMERLRERLRPMLESGA